MVRAVGRRLGLAHAATHEGGGVDEMSVADLAGVLADAQDPKGHAASHQSAGADSLNLGGLAGDLADAQDPKAHAASHESAGSDPMNVGGLPGDLADAQDPKAHNHDGSAHSPSTLAINGTDTIAAIESGKETVAGPGAASDATWDTRNVTSNQTINFSKNFPTIPQIFLSCDHWDIIPDFGSFDETGFDVRAVNYSTNDHSALTFDIHWVAISVI